ncbi:hypothetical protein Tdes44962_MAKER08589 [Teratosphaeria destructans]|uniref:F-box domain-containing protein n=1 Tax=Teratosphaeria destructans TaxID=418781 RepID=A0A9W7SWA9_9PEZI|nr:hypothetical protein Tdes44962_MAKER08589 [Teratosphaeria destructans]
MAEHESCFLLKLPLELKQEIALHIERDDDLCAFQLTCRDIYCAIDVNVASFWRRRFVSRFESPSWDDGQMDRVKANTKYKDVYQKRREAVLYGATFSQRKLAIAKDKALVIRKAINFLETLRDLMKDSFSEKSAFDDGTVYESANMKAIHQLFINHDILLFVLQPERNLNLSLGRTTRSTKQAMMLTIPTDLLQTIQVMLAPALLSLNHHHIITNHFDFPTSQEYAYGTAADATYKIFTGVNGMDVNMTWVLQNLNFWKYHLTRQAELTLWSAYKDLEDADKPRFWSRQLQNGNLDLGKNWKGSYAYVDRPVIHQIRRGEGHEKIIQDEFNGDHHDAFQSLRFESVNPDEGSMWPEIFERHLHSLSQPQHSRAKTRAQHRSASPTSLPSNQRTSFQFRGIGQDAEEDFEALGWINALPSQHGIPGWQRMTMMKYYWVDVETGVIDEEALWAYEGVVLPGGQVVVGRWWCTSDGVGEEMYSGPFILWCVDGPGDNEEEEMET